MNFKNKENLNFFVLPSDDGTLDESTTAKNYSLKLEQAQFESVETYFRDIESKLIDKILDYKDDLIVGCVAWLTSFKILEALSKCRNVQIIVQKEDFLRPDLNTQNQNDWKTNLREKYSNVKCNFTRHEFMPPMSSLSYCGDPTVDAVRCVGNHNSVKTPAFPRMHNKFLVFCRVVDIQERYSYKATSVWTGSFNLTQNAVYSLENAICLNDSTGENPIINSYLKEHHQIFCLSENLDWTTDWIEPEFRIGS